MIAVTRSHGSRLRDWHYCERCMVIYGLRIDGGEVWRVREPDLPEVLGEWHQQGDGMKVELANCERMLLEEIADKDMKRRDVAQTYALALKSSEKVDWAKVNAAIVARWSVSALAWIKERAWTGKAFGPKQ